MGGPLNRCRSRFLRSCRLVEISIPSTAPAPDAVVGEVARRDGVHANVSHRWRLQAREGSIEVDGVAQVRVERSVEGQGARRRMLRMPWADDRVALGDASAAGERSDRKAIAGAKLASQAAG